MAVEVRNIRALHWQPTLNADGEVVEGLADVAQAIRIILTTPKGSDPHRPEFGSDIWQYIDWPVTEARAPITREAREAIGRWEPRAELLSVDLQPANGRLWIQVRWRLAGGFDDGQTTEVAP